MGSQTDARQAHRADGDSPEALALVGVRKAYGSTVALDGASLRLVRGETTGLIGENGAGKSTLVRILSGLVRPDAGEILMNGHVIGLSNPTEARRRGIATVWQELSLVPDLTAVENLLLGTGRRPWIHGRRARQAFFESVAAEWGLADLNPMERVYNLPLRDRQLLEIVGAAARQSSILILDEPTSSLLPRDVDWLYSVVQKLKSKGTSILFISHSFDEVERFCSNVTIQRNGRTVASHPIADFRRDVAIEQMIGRSLVSAFPPKPPLPPDPSPLLLVRNLRVRGDHPPLTFSVARGEIVGVAGLEGQGQRGTLEALAGVSPAHSGDVELAGSPVRLSSPAAAMRRDGGGIAFVPAERKTQGLVLDLSVRKNASLSALRRLAVAGMTRDRVESAEVADVLAAVNVAPERANDPVRQLSGGNQQKVVFAKAAMARPELMVLYDPTRGVDVGTKFEIYRLIQQAAVEGQGVLLYSTEIPELVNLCTRVLVMYQNRIVAELGGADLTEASIMGAAIGAERGQAGAHEGPDDGAEPGDRVSRG